jgi:hypothetical protein
MVVTPILPLYASVPKQLAEHMTAHRHIGERERGLASTADGGPLHSCCSADEVRILGFARDLDEKDACW